MVYVHLKLWISPNKLNNLWEPFWICGSISDSKSSSKNDTIDKKIYFAPVLEHRMVWHKFTGISEDILPFLVASDDKDRSWRHLDWAVRVYSEASVSESWISLPIWPIGIYASRWIWFVEVSTNKNKIIKEWSTINNKT